MKTQSSDTSIEAERVLIELIRKASTSKRFRLVRSMTQGAFLASIQAQKKRLDMDEREMAIRSVSIAYDPRLAQQLQSAQMTDASCHIRPIDLTALICEVAQVLDELRVEWYLGGSIASSLHGMQQLAQDIDFVVYLDPQQLPTLLSHLKGQYLFNEEDLQNTVSQRVSFSLIHLESLMKIDIVLPSLRTFDIAMKQLVTSLVLDERYPAYPVASASEMILFKLYRYYQDAYSRKDGMKDDAGWNDILGMLKIQGTKLDLQYLRTWADALGVRDLLEQAIVDTK